MGIQNNSSFKLVMFAVFFGNFLATLSTTTINVTFPVIMSQFNVNLSVAQWLMAGYLLATGIVAPIIGYLGDQLSYKRLFTISLLGFTLFSLLCAVAWNIHSLITFRIIQGVFGGMIIPITMTIIYQVIEPHRQSQAMGLWSLASMLAPAIGPTLGGWLIQCFGWKSIFLLNIPIGILSIFVVIKFVPYYKLSEKKSFDILGFISVIIGSSFLLVTFSHGSDWGWLSLKTLSLLISGLLALAFFIFWELKIDTPLLQLRVFKFSRFTYSLIINCIVTISLYVGILLVPLYLQKVLYLSPRDTGLVMLPGAIVMAGASPIVGMLYDEVGPFKLVMTGILLIVGSTGALSHINIDTSVFHVAILQLIRCLGISLCYMPLTNSGMSAVSKEYSGHASSITNWVRQGVASLSIGIFSSILMSKTSYYSQLGINSNISAMNMGINDVFLIGAMFCIIAIPLTFLLRRNS